MAGIGIFFLLFSQAARLEGWNHYFVAILVIRLEKQGNGELAFRWGPNCPSVAILMVTGSAGGSKHHAHC